MGTHYSGIIQVADYDLAIKVLEKIEATVERASEGSSIWVVQYEALKLSPELDQRGEEIQAMLKDVPWKWSYVCHDYPSNEEDEIRGELWSDELDDEVSISVNLTVSISW